MTDVPKVLPGASRRPFAPEDNRQAIVLHTLACRRDLDMALSAIRRVSRFCTVQVHDDGTLDDRDAQKLSAVAANVHVVRKSLADSIIGERLARFPRSLQFRGRNVFGLKLFDAALMSDDVCCYFDSDILFFQDPHAAFGASPEVDVLMMADTWSGVAVKLWDFPWRPGIAAKANAGMYRVSRRAYDLEFIDWMLGRSFRGYASAPSWVEQTCWAALGLRCGMRLWDPRRVCMGLSDFASHPDVVAVHFATNQGRDRFWQFADAANGSRPHHTLSPVPTIPARRLTFGGLFAERLRRRLN
jgi:hypothetical protein